MNIVNPGLPVGVADTPANRLQLFQTVFSGVVLDAMQDATVMDNATYERPCAGKKADSFDLVGDATAGYHANVGDEVDGQDIGHASRLVALDRPIISAVRVDDWENLVNHFELYGRYANKLGYAIAKLSDQHKMFQILRSAKGLLKDGSAIANMPSGLYTSGTELTMTNATKSSTTASAIANDIAYQIMEGEQAMVEKQIGVEVPKTAIVKPTDFFVMHQSAVDGKCPWLNVDYKGENTYGNYSKLMIGNVEIKPSNHFIGGLTKTAGDAGYELYNGDASTLRALMFTDEAVATLNGMQVQLEKGRDFVHQNDMLIARKAEGHDTFNPACAVAISQSV